MIQENKEPNHLVVSRIGYNPIRDGENYVKNKQKDINEQVTAILSAGNFSSRGTRALAAALGDKTIQPDIRKALFTQHQPPQSLNHHSDKTLVTLLPSRIIAANNKEESKFIGTKSPKSKVLFKEPVVTHMYQYEQVALLYDKEDQTPPYVKLLREARRAVNHKRSTPTKPPIATPLTSSLNSKSHNKDVTVENCSISSTTLEEDNLNRDAPIIDTMNKNSKKRSYDEASSDDLQDILNKNSGQEDGCLFSSPKVAKISPFFHDKEPNDDSAHNQYYSTNRSQKKPVQRELLPSPFTEPSSSETYARKESFSPTKSFDGLEEDKQHLEDKQGYLSWIVDGWNYFALRMNKIMLK